MASVPLDFTPPFEPNIVKLHIEEAATQFGPFAEIEEVTAVGSYPNYITRYTTSLAASLTDWFRIRWEDSKGAMSPYSLPIQGGTTTLVQQIIDRVMIRDPNANENVVQQEAETVIEEVLGVLDAYAVDPATVTSRQKSGITFLALARANLSSLLAASSVSGTTTGYTAGLVSQSTGSNAASQVQQHISNVQQLIDWANRDLGLNYSVKLLLAKLEVAGKIQNDMTFEALGL